MPCYYTGSAAGDRELAVKEALGESKKELDQLTRMLCAVLAHLEATEGARYVENTLNRAGEKTKGLTKGQMSRWWAKHKLEDAKRKKAKKPRR